ncbi:MAG: ATP-binding protein, partial [Anaerolineae bacterium]|nr:ATP-binding protein [Anaerolineae bacterium]
MPFIEAPTSFYLGRRYTPEDHRLTEDIVYYDSRDLTTHAVVVGMTGSGKTGLCINLLEEAVLDNIPSIIIDPKGDITNLLLTFPDFREEDFVPWVNVDEARRAKMSVEDYAADTAHRWKEGLASWHVVPDRVRWLKYAARYSIYTPGSDAGLPVSILASLRAPHEGWHAGNEEMLREKINGVTTALLALVGRDAQPVQDREHVLIANIFEHAWRNGIDLTLEDIILQVQKPPFNKLGVFPLDEYISEKVRLKLAMELNGIVAAPSFQSWMNGDPMDMQNLLYQPDGKPRVSVFYIAHLNEAERQFVITLLLENMLGWMRSLSGTTSLRCLLYIDEMFGYFPPFPRNPPTKDPILRLLKQARAFGIGLILATQNPADLDYKGLSNAGTWFIGRLQSDQDKERVAAGLQSLVSVNNELDLRDVRTMISDIEPRVFLMHNIHDQDGPVFVHTRWAMSYLRGPLTRQQVQILMADQKAQLMTATGSAYPANASQSERLYNPKMPLNSALTPPTSLPEMPTSLPELPEIPTQSAPIFPQAAVDIGMGGGIGAST